LANAYTQTIEVRLKVEQLNRELNAIEARLKKIQQVNIQLTATQQAVNQTKQIATNFEKVKEAVSKVPQAIRNVIASALLLSGIFDKQLASLEKELKVMENINIYFKNYTSSLRANVQSLNSVDKALRGVQNAWGKVTYDVDIYNRLAQRQVELEKTRDTILRRQADAIRRQRQEQEALYAAVQRTVRESVSTREVAGSGFREFSQAAGGAVRRRVEADRQAEKAAIEELDRLREVKELNSYNTAQKRKRYLADLDQKRIDEYFKKEEARIKRIENEERAAAQRSARFRENLLLGAGFPLLFGGGPGAVGGGLLGSLFGDGFGGQIFLSALGTQLDQLSLFTQNVAKAFREGGDAAGLLEQALGYLDPQTKNLINNLKQSGQTALAAATAQRALASEIGVAGANALRQAGERSDEYARSIKKLGLEFYASALAASQFFQNLRGDYGRIPSAATPVTEDPTTKAAQERVTNLTRSNDLLRAQAQLESISRTNNADAYAAQQKVIAAKERDNALAQIKQDLDNGLITLAERKAKKEEVSLKYTAAINTANRQLAESKERQAEAAAREAKSRQEELERAQKLRTKQLDDAQQNYVLAQRNYAIVTAENELQKETASMDKTRAERMFKYSNLISKALSTKEVEFYLETQRYEIETERVAKEKEKEELVNKTIYDLNMQLLKAQAITDVEKLAIQFMEIENQLKEKGVMLSEADAEAIRKKLTEIQKTTQEQEKMQQLLDREKQLYTDISNTLVSTLGGAFDAALDGTKNFSEALRGLTSDLLAAIGKMLIFYAIGSALKGLAGGKNDDAGGILTYLAKGFGFAEGGYVPGGFKAFANGGMVTRPTMGLVGEGGEAEYIIPASKMAGAMARYSAGTRGSNVIPDSSAPSAGGPGGSNTFTLETVVINNVEYATVEQVRELSARAARDGAEGGYTRSMSALRNSRSQRSRIGLR